MHKIFIRFAFAFLIFAAVVPSPFSQSTTFGPSSSNDNNVEWGGLLHDTFDTNYRSPFGAVMTGSTVNIKFRTFKNDVTAVFMRVYAYDPPTSTTNGPTDIPLAITSSDATYDYWGLGYQTPAVPKIIYYKFRIVDGTSTAFYTDSYVDDHDNLNQGGTGAAAAGEPFPAFQLTVYSSNFTTPAWIQNSAVYHVFPDRFRNGDVSNDWCRNGSTTGCPSLYGGSPSSNISYSTWNTRICDPRQASPCPNNYGSQFFGGDLKGVEQKLDYIKGLGFDAIYLNPVFKARSNHRYDTDDYRAIADELGGDAAFASLTTAADSRGMKIILDGVFNHMSQDSEYFDYYHRSTTVGACEGLGSSYRTWFIFLNNNTPCTTADYPGWFGFGGLPVLDKNLPAVRDFFYRTPTTNVTQYWYDRGAGGWRFDVATDIPHDFWNEYRGFAKTFKPDGVLIGEIFPDSSQYLAGDQLDSVMNYRFRKNVLGFARAASWVDNDNNGNNFIPGLSPSQMDTAMRSIREDYPEPAQRAMLNLLDSHDTNRALFTLTIGGDTGLIQAKERLKLAAAFQFTYNGAPMVYYGDEAGINAPSVAVNGNGQFEDDPYNRAPYPWADEAGDANIYGPADNALISYYAKLGAIRKRHTALRTGSFTTVLTGDTTASTTDNNTFAFARMDARDRVVVALNNGNSSNTATLPVAPYFPDGATVSDLLNNTVYTVSGGSISVTLPARGVVILSRPATAAPIDLDGDGKTDLSIFRPNGVTSEWWWLNSGTGGNSALQFGASTDKIVPTDFTGDGKTDVAFWRPSTGQWFVLRSEDFSFFAFPFGVTSDVPVPADYDGDGKSDAAVFRESSLTWFINRSSGGTDIIGFGAAGDKPVVSDYDGDGKADIAIFRPNGANGAEWWLTRSTTGAVFATQFGASTDKTVVGDYTGDGKADIAFWRASTGFWNVLRSEDLSFYAFPFGASTDIPSPGDYDGDGRIDAGIFRPSNATWFAQRSTAGTLIQQFGSVGDQPLPNAFVR